MISVLYVDDEPNLLEVAQLFLEDTGEFRVGTAISAKNALNDDSIRTYDVIVSDYQMPGMDGIAFLKAVRERFGDIPFILFTGRGREEVVIEAINNGADSYLQKGGDPEAQFAELAHRIQQAVRRKQAERSHQDSERRLSDIIDFLPDATFAIDRSGHVIAWNRAIEDMTGIPAGDMLGKGDYAYAVPFYGSPRPILIDLIDETDEKISQFYTNICRDGTSLTAETDLPHPKGRRITVLIKVCHLFNQAGEITGTIESIRDITERKRLEMDLEKEHGELQGSYEQLTAVEEELRDQYDELARSEQQIRESESKYRSIIENSPLGMHFYALKPDRTLVFTGANPSADRILGIDHTKFAGQAIETAFPGLAGTEIAEQYKDVAENGGIWQTEQVTYDGEEIHGAYAVIAFRTAPRSMVAVFEDITERKRTGEEISFKNAILSTQQETSLDGILIVDETGKILNYNWRFIEIWGIPENLVAPRIDEPVLQYVIKQLADPEAFHSRVKYLYEHKDEKSFEELLLKDGRILERFSAPMFGETGKYYGRIWYFRDITRRKRAELSLKESVSFLNSVIEQSPYSTWISDNTGTLIKLNQACRNLLHITDEDVVGKYNLFHDNIVKEQGHMPLVRKVFEAGEPANFPLVYDSAKLAGLPLSHTVQRTLSVTIFPIKNLRGEVTNAVIQHTDITERIRGEAKLRESENKFATVFRSSPVALTLVSATDGTFIDVNDTFTRSTGYSREEVIGKTTAGLGIFVNSTELEQMAAALRSRQSVQGVELKCRTKNGAIRTCRFTSGIIMMGGMPHILSSVEDVTEHKTAEAALIESERRYRNLYQYALVGLFETSLKDATIIACNQQYSDLAGFASPEDARGKDVLHLYANPEDRTEIARILHEQKFITDHEVQFINQRTGRRFWARISAQINSEKDIAEGTLIDITSRKEAEDALRVSEEKYRLLTENSIDIIYSMDLEGNITHISPQVIRYGYTPDQLISHNISEVIAEEDLPRIREDIKTTVATEKSTRTTFRLKGSPESPVWLEDNGTVIKKADGIAVGISGVLRDITGRMKAEEALRESEAKLRRLAENAPDMIYRMSLPDGRYEYISLASLAMTGYTPEEFYSDPGLIRRLIHPDWHEYFRKQWDALLANKVPPFYEFQIIDKAGNIRWVNQRNMLVSDTTGKPVAIEGIVTDITRQKNSELELRRSELRFLAVNENAGSWIWEVDPEGVYRYSSPAVNKMLGYRPEELVGTMHFYDLFDSAVRDNLKTLALNAFSSREPFRDFVNLNRHKNGTPVLMSTSGTPVFDDDGTFTGYCGVDEDISERTASQSALQAMVRSMVGITGFDSLKKITGSISSWLGADCVMVGKIQPDHQTVKVISMILDGKQVQDFTYTLKGTPCENVAEKGFCLYPDDAVRLFPESRDLVELNIRGYIGTPLRDSRGDVIGILCVLSRNPIRPSPQVQEIMDIIGVKAAAEIERIGIERELKESQVMLAKAMDLTAMVNWEYDPVTDRFVFNDRFYALYATSAEREGGYQMTPERYNQEFVYPDDRDAVAAVFRTAPASAAPGFEFPMEHRIIRRDGAIRHILVRVGAIADSAGRTVIVHGANQDITERKQAEEALRQAHKKLHLLSGITRHDIGNQLMTLNGFVGLLHKKNTDPSLENYFSRIMESGRQITAMIAFTKEYEKIGVHEPVWQLLGSVVNGAGKGILPDQIQMNNEIPENIEVFADPLIVKVFFNLLDNSIRHGQRVTEIRVSCRQSGNDLVVVWEDNGVGIAMEDKEQIFGRGFGKNTGLGMFLVREILSLTGITIRETGTPLEGARFEIVVPRGAYRTVPER